MIKGLFETHLFVASLEHSIDFYQNTLELELAHIETERRVAFFWIGNRGEAMLGIWEKPVEQIEKRHFAFRCDVEDVLLRSANYLKARNLKGYNFLKDGTDKPMVFAWMPAIAIYFTDPDGHYLEFIAMLEGEPKPELGVIAYEKWKEKKA